MGSLAGLEPPPDHFQGFLPGLDQALPLGFLDLREQLPEPGARRQSQADQIVAADQLGVAFLGFQALF